MQCSHQGCNTQENLIDCFYPDNQTETPNEIYCTDHCFEHGFCWGCGYFWGGVESFEFAVTYGGVKDLCENCSQDILSDISDYEDDYLDDDFDDRFGYYGED